MILNVICFVFSDKSLECMSSPTTGMSPSGKEWKPTDKFIIEGDAELEAINEFFAKKVW